MYSIIDINSTGILIGLLLMARGKKVRGAGAGCKMGSGMAATLTNRGQE